MRARAALLSTGAVLLGFQAGGVFDRLVWSIPIAAAVVAIAGTLLIERWWPARLATTIVGGIVGVVVAVIVVGGDLSDVAAALGPGIQRILSTDWPSPDRPDLVGAMAALVALGLIVAVELAARRRFHLLPLLPLAVGIFGHFWVVFGLF